MAKNITINNDGTITVEWLDGSSDTWRPDESVDLTNYSEIGAEVRRYSGI